MKFLIDNALSPEGKDSPANGTSATMSERMSGS
jgi:hypothetical protein